MKRWITSLGIALSTAALAGASAWEGSAMMSAYGEFPESGYYAACNSFPRNTAVEVVNLENGKSVTVIVTKGLDNPGIFLLLSPEAAKAVSMEPGMVFRVRVSDPRNIAEVPPAASGSSGDPDYNPSLLAARSGAYRAPEPPKTVEPAPAAEGEPSSQVALGAEIPPEETPAAEESKPAPPKPAGEPDVLPPPPEAAMNGTASPETREATVARPEVLARTASDPGASAPVTAPIEPPGTLEPEGRPEEKALIHGMNRPASASLPVETALADPVLVPDGLPETALVRQAWPEESEPRVALADLEIRMDESGKPEALARSSGEPPAEDRTPEVGLEEPAAAAAAEPMPAASPTEPAAPEESEVVVSLEPTAPRPPQTAAEAAPPPAGPAAAPSTPSSPAAKPPEAKAGPLPPAEGLVPGMHYIQVGAYRSSPSLDAALSRLRETFPVTVDTVQAGSGPVYRLFIGPLGRDETGVALLRVRSLGFQEAFLKN